MIDLQEIGNQPVEVQEAIIFYNSFGVTVSRVPSETRYSYYLVLEDAGLIEKLGELHGID